MPAHNRLSSGGQTSPSPPASPSRFRHVRTKRGRFNSPPPSTSGASSPKPPPQRIPRTLRSLLHRRQGVFLFAPLIYILCMFFYTASLSLFDVLPFINHLPPPGSLYNTPLVYANLRPHMDADTSASQSNAISTIWKLSHQAGHQWRPCLNNSSGGLPESNGYIYVDANGGLNQQRTSICNAVAVAGYLNATLVIPQLHYHSIWKDPSAFKDIYDEDFFLSTLKNDVRVVDKIPGYLMERYDGNRSNLLNFKVKSWAHVQYYKDEILPKLLEEKVIRISPFANRLSSDAPLPVQRLRCIANYEALRFSSPILSLGESLVKRMKNHSLKNSGKYISVHLRFEEDMVAFSCCVYHGGTKEEEDMKAERERGWRGKFTRAGRVIRPGANRIDGKCPLTPLEVGLMLRGMGFDNTTSIYLASGEIYNADTFMPPLLEMFPLLQTKETLASEIELAPFKKFSSRMAAIDYTVCLHSEVFVTTQGGNFAQSLLGHRRYMFGGHSKTIRPDKRKLVLFLDNPNIGERVELLVGNIIEFIWMLHSVTKVTRNYAKKQYRWENFKRQMLLMRAHSDSKGFELKRKQDSIYSFPCPNCMCHVKKTEDRVPASVI